MHYQTYNNKKKLFKRLANSARVPATILMLILMGCSQSSTSMESTEKTISTSCQNTSSQNIQQLIYLAEKSGFPQGNYAEAERLWQEVIRLEPDYMRAYERLGFIFYQQSFEEENKLERAAEVYRQAIQRNPESAKIHYDLGKVLLAQQKLPEAIASYRQAIQLSSSYAINVDWFAPPLSLGQVLQSLDQEIEAKREPISINYLLLGDAFRQARQGNLAMDFAQQNFFDICQQYLQGCTERYVVRPNQELDAFRKAIQLDPKSAIAYEMLGVSLYQLENYDEAVVAFKQSINLDPQSVRVYYQLGDVFIAQDKANEAVQTFYQAAQVNPRQVEADSGFWWSGLNHLRMQPHNKAIAALWQELQTEPSAVGYYLLGNALTGLHIMDDQPAGREQAIAAFRQAIQLEPTFAKAHTQLGYILMIQGKQEEAEQSLRQAIQLDPTLISAYANLQNLLRDQQRFAEAEQAFCAIQSTN